MQVLQGNPVESIRGSLGREDREVCEGDFLTEPELGTVLAVAEQREPRLYPCLLGLVSTGIRLGEALGLQIGDVYLERGRLHIRRSVRKLKIGSPKNGKPRWVDVPPSTIAVLRGWIDTVRAEAALRGQEATWFFPSQTGHLLDSSTVRDALRRTLQAAGIPRPLRVHDLRHTYASLAIQRGVPLLTVSRQLGHKSIRTTADIYGHISADATREAAMAWEAILTAPGHNPGATRREDPA